jgi:hypothetical protein
MPTYKFMNKESQEEFDVVMSYSELENFINENPNLQQVFILNIADPTRLGLRKPDSAFRDILKNVKKTNKGSNVNTF